MALFKDKKQLDDIPVPKKTTFPDFPKPDFNEDEEEELPSYKPSFSEDFSSLKELKKPMRLTEMPRAKETNKPFFIKIDKYEEAMANLNSIKVKIEEVESIINSLRQIKREEDSELEKWQNSLNSIKDKLIMIDQTLFES